MITATHKIPGLILTDHTFVVPLDHSVPNGEEISIFAREVVAAGKESAGLPWLLFLQGGPGFASPRPTANDGWLKRALQDYRVLLLDQRGTGRSSPLSPQTPAQFASAADLAIYLKAFRADAIVQDAEFIRRDLLGNDTSWSVLGQSFGGFCIAHYLCAAPEGLSAAIITGGLPPLTHDVDAVYRATYQRVIEKNRLYYNRYPDDAERAQAIVQHLASHTVELPTGVRLSPRRFQQLGWAFGASDGFEEVHYLLESAFADGKLGSELGYGFLRGLENSQPFDTNPIYAVLHEAIYCQQTASRWAADRVHAEYPAFALAPTQPVFFTGEMIYPWMFEEYPHLQPFREAAELLAHDDTWPMLYDRTALQTNTVPCAAVIYYNDMYVERTFAEETAAAIAGIKVWLTNEYEHNALRADGDRVLDRLLGMLRGDYD